MIKQMEWGVRNEPNTKNGVLPETTLCIHIFFSVSTKVKNDP